MVTAGQDGTVWLEESHSLIKVDETASFLGSAAPKEIILIYVEANVERQDTEKTGAYIMITMECKKGGIAPRPHHHHCRKGICGGTRKELELWTWKAWTVIFSFPCQVFLYSSTPLLFEKRRARYYTLYYTSSSVPYSSLTSTARLSSPSSTDRTISTWNNTFPFFFLKFFLYSPPSLSRLSSL